MVSATCLNTAGVAYGVTPAIIRQVLETARGVAHPNGIGVMNIPAEWVPILRRVGFVESAVRSDDCANVLAGSWILAFESMGTPGGATAPAGGPIGAGTAAVARFAGVAPACVSDAAAFYRLPERLLAGVLATEHARDGQVSANANGSYDMGPAQINSTWLPRLEKAGISRTMLLSNGCLNIAVGAWILAQSMFGGSLADPADYWRHVGNYNSHTPAFNQAYQRRVWEQVRRQDGG